MTPGHDCTGDDRKRIGLLPPACAMIAVLNAMSPCSAEAQDAGAPSGLQVLVTPYLWAPAITTHVKTSIPQLPTVTENVSFDKLLTHLSPVPFMGTIEVREGAFGGLVDYIHVPVRTSITTRNVFFNGGTAGLVADTATVEFLYRPLAQPQQYLDIGFGVRPWGVSTELSLNAGLLPGRSFSTGGSWADPLIAVRYHRALGSGFGLTGYGDVGGFGLGARVDWQLMGTVDYVVRPWLEAHLGYRALAVDYNTRHDVGFNVNMHGPIIAGTIRF
jgi:hypothetical protein